ncbi:hypothetical protein FNJ87_08130 [Nonlabens mediterrranea]|uniref:Secreted protein n=1 Tax=Nonlabens mediterrranea TaxID=1419947 RepID=A0ABS0A4I9_9FLAO|nr:hypothetical protein [Nonlabens mediterrranea]
MFFILLGLNVHAQRYNTASSYLQFIDSNHEKVINQTWNYMYSYSLEPNLQKRKGQRKVLENVLKKAIRNIEKEIPFDANLQKAAMKYLKDNLSIVQYDYVQLLKVDSQEAPEVDKNTIFRRIRNAMYQLRMDYDAAITDYASKHDLIINSNNNQLAQRMAATIKIYDHYNEMNFLVQQIKMAEAYLWQDITNLSPQEFSDRLADLDQTIKENQLKSHELSNSIDIKSLQLVYDSFSQSFGNKFMDHTGPILEYLEAVSLNDRTDIIAKTEAFNTAKTWFNLNRRDSYSSWSTETSKYIQDLISGL